jgi:pilus assembly protein CpaB
MTGHLSKNTIAALGLAVLATILTLLYLGSGKTNASTTKGLIPVLVATHDIPAGTAGISLGHAIAVKAVAPDAVTVGALRRPQALTRLVSTQPIYAGDVITLRRFATSRGNTSLAGLRGNERAVDVSGEQTQLLAGTLQDGDHVDVVASVSIPNGSQHHESRIVLRNLRVLHAPSASGSGTTSAAATLVLTDAQALRLFYVIKNADWSLLLRPTVRASDSNVPNDSAASVLGRTP